nr:hypothetical protein [Planosporangium flavigriseum]
MPGVVVSTAAPIGGGLSSSTALVVALMRLFLSHCQAAPMGDIEIARLAYEFEFTTCHGGGMDQLAIALGGAVLTQGCDGRLPDVIDRVEFPSDWIAIVVDSKIRKSTARHIACVRTQVATGDSRLGEYCHRVDAITEDMWNALLAHQLHEVSALVADAHEAMRDCQDMSTDRLELLRKLAFEEADLHLKVCGAGGGGSLVGVAHRDDAQAILSKCRRAFRDGGLAADVAAVEAV